MRRRFARQFGNPTIANAITFCTINALCLRIYKKWCRKKPQVRCERDLIQEKAAKRLLRGICKEFKEGYVSEGDLTDLETRISWVKNSMANPREFPQLDEDIPRFAEMYERYCDRLKAERKMDFDDQLRFAKFALEHDGDLLEEYRRRYRYWCVDEAQDTSRIQHCIIRMLAGSGNVFMVGDEDQSIYGYRGAYPEALLRFEADYGSNARVLKMETNYRSGDEIVSVANDFISCNKGRIDKHMVSAKGPGSTVCVEEVGSRLDQFDVVIGLINEHGRAGKGTLAVLYRNNETAVPLADLLIREDMAFKMGGKVDTLLTSPTVMDVKAFMRLAMNPYDEDAFMRVYMKGGEGRVAKKDAEWACRNAKRNKSSILDAFVDQMSSYRKRWQVRNDLPKAMGLAALVSGIATLSPLDAIEHLLSGGYGEWLESTGKSTRSIELLKPIAAREMTMASFLGRLDFLRGTFDKERPNHRVSNKITLATMHSCKGCEFDTVVIIDAIDGVLPSGRMGSFGYVNDEDRELREERRLFYVAMTRAKDELVLLRPADEGTPFVDEVLPRLRPLTTPSSAVAGVRVHEAVPSGGGSLVTKTVPVPEVSRYDVDAWETVESRGDAYRRAVNGGKEAEITNGPAGRTVDLRVPWMRDVILDVAEHAEEFAQDCSEFAVHMDVTRAQQNKGVRIEMTGVDAISLRLDEGQPVEALSRLVLGLRSLEGVETTALLRFGLSEGDRDERRVQEVDEHARRILVCVDPYEG